MMRMKYSTEPEKFMESEIELHADINDLYALAASPELYPILFDSGISSAIQSFHSLSNVKYNRILGIYPRNDRP